MKFLNSGNVVRIALSEIVEETRLRSVSESGVENLMLMAEDVGITTPIHVRKFKGQYVLIDGAHRLEASRRMGRPDIAALVVECGVAEARTMEAANNLGGARMTPLQTAVFVASWKRDYYAKHPDRKPGVFKGNQYAGNVVGGTMPLTKTIADAFGVDESTVHRALRAGESLTAEEAAQLEAGSRRVTMKDLQVIAKVGNPIERYRVVDMLAQGDAKSAADARQKWKVSQPGYEGPAPVDKDDAALSDLLNRFDRAPMAAKRRFLEQRWPDMLRIMRDAAPVEGDAE